MQNELFESAFKFAAIGMALVSPTGSWLKVNQALLDLLGYTEDELLKFDFLQITHPEDLKADLDLLSETLRGKRETYQMEKRYFNKQGQIVWVILSVSLIRNQDGTPRFFISQVQDITELKKSQQRLQYHNKMMALGEMSAGIAHEINNPLTIINLQAKALEQLVNEPNINRDMVLSFTEKINDTVDRISSIVSSLRKFSSDNNKMENFGIHNVSTIINEHLGFCFEKCKSHRVELNVSVPDDLFIECNPLDISLVLINLMNNAFYAIKNFPHKKITISAEKDGEKVLIRVMDSGPGIPEKLKTKIWDPFFTTKSSGDGTGLGLSISNNILKLHYGDIFLDEASDQTCFIVRLPLLSDLSTPSQVTSTYVSEIH